MKPQFKVGDRVKWADKAFLTNGKVIKVVNYFGNVAYIVKTDQKAPNEYAWETDELLAFPTDIEPE